VVEKAVVDRFTKNCDVALLTSARARHRKPAAAISESVLAFVLDRVAGFLVIEIRVRPPPWIDKAGDDAVKNGAVEEPFIDIFQKVLDGDGASFGNSSMVKEPCEVSNLTMVRVLELFVGKRTTPAGLRSCARARRDRGGSVRE